MTTQGLSALPGSVSEPDVLELLERARRTAPSATTRMDDHTQTLVW